MNKTIETLYSDHIKRGQEWIEVARAYYEVQTELKILEKREDLLKKMLLDLSENRNSIGGGFKYTSTEMPGRVNHSLIPELKDIDLEPYRGKGYVRWQLKKV